jgi:hypothetical protein
MQGSAVPAESVVQVVPPPADCTVRRMIERYAAVQENIARFDLESNIIEQVEGWENCRDRMAEVLGEDDGDEDLSE